MKRVFILFIGSILFINLSIFGQDGSLDVSFGSDGITTTTIGLVNKGQSIAIQSDGKIVVAGYSHNGSNYDFAVIRRNVDGTLDTDFDSDGKVITAIGAGDDFGRSVAIQSDGKIVVAGQSNGDFVVIRYNIDGSLDTGFDSDGKVTTDVGSSDDSGKSVAIQSDGKIVVAGYSYRSNADITVVRYNSDGTLDTSFDGDGIVFTTIGTGDDFGSSVAIQSDGKIVVCGSYNNSSDYDFAVVRYNDDGSLDANFNSDGKTTIAIGTSNDWARSIAIQSDGKIVVAGYSHNGSNYDYAVIRCNIDGSLDTGFDSDGKITTAIGSGNDYGRSVAIQSDGKIVVAGSNSTAIVVVRYNNPSLPVELKKFTANARKNSIVLSWQTSTEVNNFGFSVQRKTKNTEWEEIAFIEGHGNSNSPKEYSFVDSDNLNGIIQYRLKQIDTDGAYEYSDIVEVVISSAKEFKLSQNYPNPFNPTTMVSYTLPTDSKVKIEVTNMLGQSVGVLVNDNKSAGHYEATWNAENLPSGIYFINITANGVNSNESFTQVKKALLLK